MRVFKILIIVVLFSLVACQAYEPEGDYRPNIKKPTEVPNIGFEINIKDTGIIVTYWQTVILLGVDADTLNVNAVKFYLDNEEIPTIIIGDKYGVKINLQDEEEHLFEFKIYINSGSGSIADKLKAEGFLFASNERKIILKKFSSYNNGQAEITHEGLLISWNPYLGIDLDTYSVSTERSYFKKETSETKALDQRYIGERNRYNIYVNTTYGDKYLWATFWIDESFPKLRIGEVNNKIALMWEPSIFKDKIEEYIILSKEQFETTWHYLTTISADSNYTYLVADSNLLLGAKYDFGIEAVPKGAKNTSDNDLYFSQEFLKFAIPSIIDGCFFTSSPKGLVYKENDTICFYNGDTKTETPLYSNGYRNFFVSSNTKYIVDRLSYNTYRLFDIEKLKFIKTIVIDEFSDDYLYKLELTNNGIISTSIGNDVYVYDLISEQLICKESNRRYSFVSPNGKYFLIFDYNKVFIYELINNNLEIINTVDYQPNAFDVGLTNAFKIANNDSLFYSINNEGIDFFSYTDLLLTKSIKVENRGHVSVDFGNNEVLSVVNNTIHISSFTSGELLLEIPTESYSFSKAVLFNNIIFDNGWKYYLPK